MATVIQPGQPVPSSDTRTGFDICRFSTLMSLDLDLTWGFARRLSIMSSTTSHGPRHSLSVEPYRHRAGPAAELGLLTEDVAGVI